ncbi:MAG: Beta-barrel assembly-enhancing protease [Phycisphaerae bacterium]|nr:Beta-barrel assembly-enhancing protease [Phycisphaerae bacterium]
MMAFDDWRRAGGVLAALTCALAACAASSAAAVARQDVAPSDESALSPEARLAQAQRRLDQSFFELAQKSFEQVAEAYPLAAALGAAQCLVERGLPRDALARLEVLPGSVARDANWHTLRARCQRELGDYDAALDAWRAALALDAGNVEARARSADLLSYLGRRDEAIAVLRPLAAIAADALPDDPFVRVHAARGRLLLLSLEPTEDIAERTTEVLHAVLQPAMRSSDRRRWIATLASAELLASKHNRVEARGDYETVIKLNPRVADAYVGLAGLDAAAEKPDAARAQVLKALEMCPGHAAALLRLAAIRLSEGAIDDARGAVARVLETNPRDLDALALAAGIEYEAEQPELAEQRLREAASVNPRSARVNATVASCLLQQRHFRRAEELLAQAVEFEPHIAELKVALADIWLLRGQEDRARAVLKESRLADPFNERVVNMLNMLYGLEAMKRIETEHFVLRYSGEQDALLEQFVPDWLERTHDEIVAVFGHAPARRTLVEIFPSYGQLAIRLSGRPWVATVGASSGPVVVMRSPNPKSGAVFEWPDVLRHEYVHTVTLDMSGDFVPRWLTEGLACSHQLAPSAWTDLVRIADDLRARRLLTLRRINGAFLGAEGTDGGPRAYTQARLMVDFLRATWGDEIIPRLLREFARLEREARVLKEVLALDQDAFDARFAEWCTAQLRRAGLKVEPYPPEAELTARVAVDEKDAAARGMLAALRRIHGDVEAARRLSDQALVLDPRQPDAVLTAALLPPVKSEEPETPQDVELRLEEAFTFSRPLLSLCADDPVALWCVADLALHTDRDEFAADVCEQILRIAPRCTSAMAALARAHLSVLDYELAYPYLRDWIRQEPHNAEALDRLVTICQEQNEPARAVAWMERLVRLEPFNIDHHERLAQLYVAAHDDSSALRPLQVVVQQRPESESGWALLADVYDRLGRRDDAVKAAERAVAINADSPAQRILAGEPR